MSKVKLFGGLRAIANTTELTIYAATVSGVLERLSVAYPELGEALFADDNELRPHIRVIVNGLDSELIEGLNTPVKDEDQIAIFPPIAGG